MKQALRILSAGWDLGGPCGGVPGSAFAEHPPRTEIFSRDVRNFGRLDPLARAVAVAAAFALRGAGLEAAADPLPVSLLWAHTEGSLAADTAYFRDFLAFGGESGRANLFVHTLPSSPLGEISVHFGLTGSLAFLCPGNGNPWAAMLDAATDACEFRGEGAFLIGAGEVRDAVQHCLMVCLRPADHACGADARGLADLDGISVAQAAARIREALTCSNSLDANIL
jgi:hypothetical protein